MSHLFDVSPEEPVRKKAKKHNAPREQKPARVIAKTTNLYKGNAPPAIGTLDDGVACLDQNCQAQCHDILEEDRGQWYLECCFCGTGQWIPAIRGHLPAEGEFRLRGGRFDGMTFAQASRQPRGKEYITWAAAEHPRQAVREAAKTWLASNPAGG